MKKTIGLWILAVAIGFGIGECAHRAFTLIFSVDNPAMTNGFYLFVSFLRFLLISALFIRWSGCGWLPSALVTFLLIDGAGVLIVLNIAKTPEQRSMIMGLFWDPLFMASLAMGLLGAILGARLGKYWRARPLVPRTEAA